MKNYLAVDSGGSKEADVSAVYERLKDRYTLTLTNTLAVDDGFRVDIPILTACAHDRILWPYAYEGDFILDVMDSGHTKGTFRQDKIPVNYMKKA